MLFGNLANSVSGPERALYIAHGAACPWLKAVEKPSHLFGRGYSAGILLPTINALASSVAA